MEQRLEKTFEYCDECSINISKTPSGFSTITLYIRGTPYFGVGSVYSEVSIELTNCKFYYNSKKDLLLEEDIDPNSDLPVDREPDKRVHKLNFYRDPETNQYRFDFVNIAKTGNPELDQLDPWKDFNDIFEGKPGTPQMEMVGRYTDLFRYSKNEPDIIVTGEIPLGQLPLENGIGVIIFRRAQ